MLFLLSIKLYRNNIEIETIKLRDAWRVTRGATAVSKHEARGREGARGIAIKAPSSFTQPATGSHPTQNNCLNQSKSAPVASHYVGYLNYVIFRAPHFWLSLKHTVTFNPYANVRVHF